jgi:hypothetical protein
MPACGNGGHGGLVCGSGSDSDRGLLRVEVSSVRRRWRTSAGATAATAVEQGKKFRLPKNFADQRNSRNFVNFVKFRKSFRTNQRNFV